MARARRVPRAVSARCIGVGAKPVGDATGVPEGGQLDWEPCPADHFPRTANSTTTLTSSIATTNSVVRITADVIADVTWAASSLVDTPLPTTIVAIATAYAKH